MASVAGWTSLCKQGRLLFAGKEKKHFSNLLHCTAAEYSNELAEKKYFKKSNLLGTDTICELIRMELINFFIQTLA